MKNRLYLQLALLLSSLFVVFSCKDDPPPAPEPPSTNAVLIANSGLASEGTGTLTAYSPRHKTVENNVFYKANTYPLGNTVFSLLVDGDRTFVVIGGTGEILMINSDTYKVIDRVEGLGAPRYITKVAGNKYYVSDWQEEGVWELRVNNNMVLREPIPTGRAPERMAVYEDMVFVANSGSVHSDSTITVIDAVADTVMATIQVGHNPNSLQVDNDGVLWVLCGGIEDLQNPVASTPGSLMNFDLTVDSLRYYLEDFMVARDTLIFDDNQLKPTRLTMNATGEYFYFLDYPIDGNLMRYTIGADRLPTVPYIDGAFSSLGYDPIEEELYLANPLDRQNDGEVSRYTEGGEQRDLFKVGIMPENFGFK